MTDPDSEAVGLDYSIRPGPSLRAETIGERSSRSATCSRGGCSAVC